MVVRSGSGGNTVRSVAICQPELLVLGNRWNNICDVIQCTTNTFGLLEHIISKPFSAHTNYVVCVQR